MCLQHKLKCSHRCTYASVYSENHWFVYCYSVLLITVVTQLVGCLQHCAGQPWCCALHCHCTTENAKMIPLLSARCLRFNFHPPLRYLHTILGISNVECCWQVVADSREVYHRCHGITSGPCQLGYGTALGCEAAVHATHHYLRNLQPGQAILKLDFKNAFNCIRQDKML